MTTLGDKPSSDFDVGECSMEQFQRVSNDLHKLMLSAEMRNLPTKGCHVLQLKNMSKTKSLKLESKEQRGFIAKMADGIKKKVYRDVGRIFIIYVPLIQKTTSGLMTLKMIQSDTGERSDIITDFDASEAKVIMDRWGRSLVAEARLELLYSIVCTDIRPEAVVGELMVFWDETMSRRVVYSERGNPIVFPIMETQPSRYLKDKNLLMSMIRGRIEVGAEGCDVAPTQLKVEPLGDKRQVLTIKPKEEPMKESKDIKIEEVSDGKHLKEQTKAVEMGDKPPIGNISG
uniref:Movement protein n=1 Tax=Ilarvirus ApMV TaxID=12319 RepID=A0A894JHF5_9BROM|nr:movement protein [Apple mosaic virus]